jgi:GT2 family glycosyltransferase
MPAFNEEDSVVGAIESVLTQSYTDLELFVVDGGSTDSTATLVSQLAVCEPRVRLLQNPQRLIPHALNIGLAEARGRFVARVDAHATISRTYLERGVANLDSDPGLGAVGGRRIGVADNPTGRAVAAALSTPFGVGDSINHYGTVDQDTDHASFGVFRTDVVRQVGGWDEGLPVNEDVDLDHRILRAGYRILFDPEMLIFWHVQTTLRGLGRQYRRYGRGKAAMVRKNGVAAVRPRHLAAPGLILMLAGAAAAGAIGRRRAAGMLALPYPAALGVAVTFTRRRDRAQEDVDGLRLAASFATMHVAWGLGFLEGISLGTAPQASSAEAPDSSGRDGVHAGDPVHRE